MQVIDAHCHFWQLSRGDYGWLDGKGGPLQPIRRDFGPDDYPGEGLMIVVQAAPTVAETRHLLALAESDPRILGVIGWVDLAAPDAADQIRALSDNSTFKGIRPMLQDIPDTDWLERHAKPEALDTLAARGLRCDALATTRHLPMLARFARDHADLPLVIDHAAKPQPGDDQAWQDGMGALAAIPHVHCKLSGLMTELSPADRRDPFPALRDITRRLLDWFGPKRLIWGSDWPVLTLAASYREWRDLTDRLLQDLTDADRDMILRGNAARFYGVPA